jgi:hypothetical protein
VAREGGTPAVLKDLSYADVPPTNVADGFAYYADIYVKPDLAIRRIYRDGTGDQEVVRVPAPSSDSFVRRVAPIISQGEGFLSVSVARGPKSEEVTASVVKFPLPGGAATTLVSYDAATYRFLQVIDVNSAWVYVVVGTFEWLGRLPRGGGNVQLLARLGSRTRSVVATATHLYWVTTSSSGASMLVRIAK